MKSQKLPLVQVAVGVIERRGRYLLSRRRKATDHLGGYWEFPGGKRRAGESGVACLRRELLEELGVTVGQVRRLAPIHFRYPDRHVRLEVFQCAIACGTPQPLGSDAIRWVSLAQMARLRLPPADRPLVERLVGLRRREGSAIIHMRPKLMERTHSTTLRVRPEPVEGRSEHKFVGLMCPALTCRVATNARRRRGRGVVPLLSIGTRGTN